MYFLHFHKFKNGVLKRIAIRIQIMPQLCSSLRYSIWFMIKILYNYFIVSHKRRSYWIRQLQHPKKTQTLQQKPYMDTLLVNMNMGEKTEVNAFYYKSIYI